MGSTSFSAKLITFLSTFSGLHAYVWILGVLFACGLGLPIPEDITLIAAGILAGLGNISFTGALLAGFFGVLVGDGLLFFLGRKYGRRVFNLPVFNKVFTQQRIKVAEEKVLANSQFICFVARFLPGLRAPIFLTSGIMGVKPLTFLLLDGFAALISVPVWIVGGYYLAQNLEKVEDFIRNANITILSGVAFLVCVYFGIKYFKKKSRLNQSPQV